MRQSEIDLQMTRLQMEEIEPPGRQEREEKRQDIFRRFSR